MILPPTCNSSPNCSSSAQKEKKALPCCWTKNWAKLDWLWISCLLCSWWTQTGLCHKQSKIYAKSPSNHTHYHSVRQDRGVSSIRVKSKHGKSISKVGSPLMLCMCLNPMLFLELSCMFPYVNLD